MFMVMLSGRITKEPELKEVNEQTVCNFTLCVKGIGAEKYFIRCSVWNQQAQNFIKYVEKGQVLTVCGHGTMKSSNQETPYQKVLNVNCMNIEYGAKPAHGEQVDSSEETTTEIPNMNDFLQPI